MSPFFIASILFFLLTFVGLVVRSNPRAWRRKYQDVFEKDKDRKINRNKSIDEAIPAKALAVSLVFLVCAVVFTMLGLMFASVEEETSLIPDVDSFRHEVEGYAPDFPDEDRPKPRPIKVPQQKNPPPLPERGSVF